MIKISIIIPAYNAEKYIERAMNSALSQTIACKEIIVVVDGSKDNTLSIVKQYSDKYKEISYCYIPNSGLSVARNTGLEKSTGEYIAFLDSDDYFSDDNTLKNFYNISKENNLDVIRGAYKIYNERINDYEPHYVPDFPKVNQVMSGEEFLKYSMQYRFNEVVAWLGLYKREFLLKENLTFIKGIYYEDQPYLLDLLLRKNIRIMQTDEYFYVYVKRKGTITTSLSYKHAEDMAKVINVELDILKNAHLKKDMKKYALKYISSSFYQITSVYGRITKEDRKKCVKLIPFKTRLKLMCNPYNSYHFKKIFLFNFARIILDKYYDRGIKK